MYLLANLLEIGGWRDQDGVESKHGLRQKTGDLW